MSDNFRARDIALKAQKKILSRMSSKGVAKVFVDDKMGSLLDNVYRLCKTYTQNKKESEKIVKNIIKIVTKISLLARNEQFSQEELSIASEFQSKFHKAAKTVISFYEVDFSYDQKFLIQLLTECKNLLKQIVQPHLTEKSLGRIDLVFGFFSNPVFLDMVFKKNSEYNEIMTKIISDMHSALEQGEL
uniref:EOG090X0GLS n=1 Tax=Simocephalus serrulatus TaxID=117539 RepID=A0A4Y7NPK9_9CRUS|nr:EOG090X0GLS [Simocephalus serrulatus]SVE94576.1 EOG090X0GLS [Simocephalus serrulatus]